jgi:CheY-like chemotaxis protein
LRACAGLDNQRPHLVVAVATIIVSHQVEVGLSCRCRRAVQAVSSRGSHTYVLHFAYSGEEALDKLAAGIEPQLIVILSDINMPAVDGLELLREIRHGGPICPL